MPKLPKHCPACTASLTVTRLTCPSCGTEVTGNFPPDLFSRLAPNDFDFVILFVKSRGNVKEMERETGESYWAIRRRLDEVIAEMGFTAQPEEILPNVRQEILERLSRGEITAQEAASLLTQMGQSPTFT